MKEQAPVAKQASFLAVVTTIFWAFFGVRKRSDHESSTVNITPVQVVVGGLIGGALFVFILIFVVRIIIANHGTTI
ncbi:MAG: DUF2970 domain-containing protein [Proteobacteria bacterium]|nr:DUF2970 domain-containing protein [Pseudomonadota bacterium]